MTLLPVRFRRTYDSGFPCRACGERIWNLTARGRLTLKERFRVKQWGSTRVRRKLEYSCRCRQGRMVCYF
jgi:hypothetical protein